MKIPLKITDLLIGKTLLWGSLISATIVFLGGSLFLIEHGMETHANPMPLTPLPLNMQMSVSLPSYLTEVITQFDARSLIMFGVCFLLITQLVRVLLTMGYFIENKETFHACTSFCVFALLIYSIFSNI